MIVPLTNKASDVNVALVRIASMNNADIDEMNKQVTNMKERETELQARFKSQQRRWRNYKATYDSIFVQASVLGGAAKKEDLLPLLPGDNE